MINPSLLSNLARLGLLAAITSLCFSLLSCREDPSSPSAKSTTSSAKLDPARATAASSSDLPPAQNRASRQSGNTGDSKGPASNRDAAKAAGLPAARPLNAGEASMNPTTRNTLTQVKRARIASVETGPVNPAERRSGPGDAAGQAAPGAGKAGFSSGKPSSGSEDRINEIQGADSIWVESIPNVILERFDKDGSGVLQANELHDLNQFLARTHDVDGDGRLNADEMTRLNATVGSLGN